MRNNKRFIVAIACVIIMGLTACGSGDDNADGVSQLDSVPITEGVEQDASDKEEQDTTEAQDVTEMQGTQAPSDGQQRTQKQDVSDAEEQNIATVQDATEAQGTQAPSDRQQSVQEQMPPDSDEELEEKLAAYREARENAKPISLGNGVTMGGSVSEEEYGISYDASILETFDSREIAEAYGAANSYVEGTLGISVETRNTTYHCVDPRIWAIYSAEDKGVANGYDPENIYVAEYCDNGTWQYLILVREGKGSAWKVIHHGSSYME